MSARGLFRATGTAAGSEAAGFGPEKKSFHATTPQIPSATTSNRYVSGRDFIARKYYRRRIRSYRPMPRYDHRRASCFLPAHRTEASDFPLVSAFFPAERRLRLIRRRGIDPQRIDALLASVNAVESLQAPLIVPFVERQREAVGRMEGIGAQCRVGHTREARAKLGETTVSR